MGQNVQFEDNIEMMVLKMPVLKKQSLFVKEFSNLTNYNGAMGQNIQF